MASKRRVRQRVCQRKQTYDTLGYAIMVSKRMQKKYMERFSAYDCRYCNGYHVGHMTHSVRAKIKYAAQNA